MTTLLSTGEGPVSYVQLSDGVCQGDVPLRLVVAVLLTCQRPSRIWYVYCIYTSADVHIPRTGSGSGCVLFALAYEGFTHRNVGYHSSCVASALYESHSLRCVMV